MKVVSVAGLRQKEARWPIRVVLSRTFPAAVKGTGVHAGWRGEGRGGGLMASVLSFEEWMRLQGAEVGRGSGAARQQQKQRCGVSRQSWGEGR